MGLRPRTLLLPGLGILGLLLVLAWYHVLPGGWFLRNLLEAPAARAERLRGEHRDARLAAIRDGLPGPGSVVFLGSSTIERWPLQDSFPGRRVFNAGIGEERAGELRERLQSSLPEDPAGIVLYFAAVDLHRDGRPEAWIEQRLAELLDDLAGLAPEVPVLVLGILPGRDLRPGGVAGLARVDAALARATRSRGQEFLPTGIPPIVDSTGRLAEDVAADAWHLNALGYRRLTRLLLAGNGPVPARLR